MLAWQTVPMVGTGLSLVAFAIAAILYAYRSRLNQRAQIIQSALPNKQIDAINATVEIFNVDTRFLDAKSKRDVVLEQIKIRSRREMMIAALVFTVAILLAMISIASMFDFRSYRWSVQVPDAPLAKATPDKTTLTVAPYKPSAIAVPDKPPTTTVEAKYLVCIGQHADGCPPGAVHLRCGISEAQWAQTKCAEYTVIRKSARAGNMCGYAVTEITCKISQ